MQWLHCSPDKHHGCDTTHKQEIMVVALALSAGWMRRLPRALAVLLRRRLRAGLAREVLPLCAAVLCRLQGRCVLASSSPTPLFAAGLRGPKAVCSADGQPEALIWQAIHEAQPGLERAHQREQDGFWECTFRRSLAEPYFSVCASARGQGC